MFAWLRLLLVALLPALAPAAWASAGMREPRDGDRLLVEAQPSLPAGFLRVEGTWARVHHHPDDAALALDLARHAAESVPSFAQRLGVSPGGPIEIVLAHTQAQFRELQPGAIPDWADGTAWPAQGLVFLRASRIRVGTDEPLSVVLDHELIHVLLGRAFGDQPVPRWLQEGLAQVWARQYTAQTTQALAQGLLGRDLVPLGDLAYGFPADPVRARLAYAQSADFVAWLQNEHGPQTIPVVVEQLRRGASFGAAMVEATGLSVAELDRRWRGRLEGSGLWLTPMLGESMFLGLGSFVLLFGGGFVLRDRRRRLRRMAEREAAEEALAAALSSEPGPEAWDFPHPQPPSAERRPWIH